LNISQPAVTRHIKELEELYNVSFFDRTTRRITLTAAGKVLLHYSHLIFEQYQQLDFELNMLQNKTEGTLYLGASTTIAQYVIPAYLARFHQRFPDIRIELTNANSQEIEQQLINKNIEIGIVEGAAHSTDLKYVPFLEDEIVLVTRKSNPLSRSGFVSVKDLTKLQLITREKGSGTSEIIEDYLHRAGISDQQLTIHMQLGSSESIKNYLIHSDTFAFLSIYSVQQELTDDRLRVVEIEDLRMNRTFSFVYRQGQPVPLAKLFMRFASLKA
jgi:LysR family transcriptional regulator, transcriptional activator of the cysJI operon